MVQLALDPDGGFLIEMYAVAGDNTLFAPEAADNLIGTFTPIGIGFDEPEWLGEIVAAEVVDDGKAVKLTVKLGNMPPELDPMADIRRFMH